MVTKRSTYVAMPLLAAVLGLGFVNRAQATVYTGNGATGFGGDVGKGTFAVTDTTVMGAPAVQFVFTSGSGDASLDNNNLVIYLSTGTTGLTDTSTLFDDGDAGGTATTVDNGREAISGYNDDSMSQTNPQQNASGTGGSQTVIAFPTGFQATYAISFAGAYDGLFQLPPQAGNGLLTYVDGSGSPYPLTLDIPLSELGLTPGQSFSFVGSLIDGSAAYRSNEAIGDATVNGTTTSLAKTGNPGFNNLITFSDFDTYTTAAVPEPTSLAVLGLGGTLALRRRSRTASK